MNKLKIRSRAKIFNKYGFHLTVPRTDGKTVSLKLYKNLPRISKFSVSEQRDAYEMFNYSIRTKGILQANCAICGTTENVEMHHRRPLKNKITDNTLKGIKVNLSRKQIPLCRACHMKVHSGQYDGPGIY